MASDTETPDPTLESQPGEPDESSPSPGMEPIPDDTKWKLVGSFLGLVIAAAIALAVLVGILWNRDSGDGDTSGQVEALETVADYVVGTGQGQYTAVKITNSSSADLIINGLSVVTADFTPASPSIDNQPAPSGFTLGNGQSVTVGIYQASSTTNIGILTIDIQADQVAFWTGGGVTVNYVSSAGETPARALVPADTRKQNTQISLAATDITLYSAGSGGFVAPLQN